MKMRVLSRCFCFFFLSITILVGCSEKEPPLFKILAPESTGIHFINEITEYDSLNPVNYAYIYNGAGVGVADINNDGLLDIFFAGNMVSSKLYLNKGNLEFEDITESAGIGTDRWCTGVTMVDINEDGLVDIYVCVADRNYTDEGKNLLFVNNGDNTFTEKAAEYGLDDPGYSTHAVFFDYDKDGDLDAFLLTNGIETFSHNNTRPRKLDGSGISTDKLYQNNGDGTFTDVSKEAGILVEGYGLGVAIADINQDGWPDIYCSNDFITNDLIYINNGDGTFTESLFDYVSQTTYNGMGMDIADFNNDGFLDITVVDMLPEDNKRLKSMLTPMNYDKFSMKLDMGYHPQFVRNTLQLNNGNGTFSEIGRLSGMYRTDWSWAPLFIDIDNDGMKDLFISNGYGRDVTDLDFIVYSMGEGTNMFGTKEFHMQRKFEEIQALKGIYVHNYVYRNNGDLTFEDKSEAWGIKIPSYSNGTAFADLDNDGDLDLIINNINEKPFIYQNQSDKLAPEEKNNYLRARLEGTGQNPWGLGAKIKIWHGGTQQYHEHYVTRGYKSSVDPVAHFGLGKAQVIDSLLITWPDGKGQLLKNLPANQEVLLSIKNAKQMPAQVQGGDQNSIDQKCWFTEVGGETGIAHQHFENEFIDFKSQPLLQQMYTKNGPGLAVGDVNGNGLDDFYVGAGFGGAGKLFLQVKPQQFEPVVLDSLSEKHEDLGALFFDANGDGHLDLYVVSGGAEYPLGSGESQIYQDRLYLNDGKGNFTQDHNALPQMNTSGSCVVAADFDQDGDLDLFVGGRVVPYEFPLPANSYILRNDNGKFTDVTDEVAPGLKKLGLVTSAVWTDFDNDNAVDLVVTGEWMPVSFFKNEGGKLTDVTGKTGIGNIKGFWNSITPGDFNNDGLTDYVLGNHGLNSNLKATQNEPVTVIAKDFDQSGNIDPITSYYLEGKSYPIHMRDALIDQVNGFKKRFGSYGAYAETTTDGLFTKSELKGAYQASVNHMAHTVMINRGNGKFDAVDLPNEAQISPVFGTLADDFDGDGNLDILMVGNLRCTELLSGFFDASYGTLLLGDGAGGFEAKPNRETGLHVNGDAKGVSQLYIGNNEVLLLIPQNGNRLKVIKAPNSAKGTAVGLRPMDASITLVIGDKTRKIEIPYGNGYLSQSSRIVKIPDHTSKITITDFQGGTRDIDLHHLQATAITGQ